MLTLFFGWFPYSHKSITVFFLHSYRVLIPNSPQLDVRQSRIHIQERKLDWLKKSYVSVLPIHCILIWITQKPKTSQSFWRRKKYLWNETFICHVSCSSSQSSLSFTVSIPVQRAWQALKRHSANLSSSVSSPPLFSVWKDAVYLTKALRSAICAVGCLSTMR